MITVSDKFRFLATPRTGSRAISDALMRKYPDAIRSEQHHVYWTDIPTDLPTYTIIRNPLDQVLSWWYHVDLRHGSKRSAGDFAKQYAHPEFFTTWDEYTLNTYTRMDPTYIPYDEGLKTAAKVLELDDLEVVGKSTYTISDDDRMELADYIARYFTKDVLLWEKHKLCQSA